jgi:Sap, sulfolipid-1-addressing protein
VRQPAQNNAGEASEEPTDKNQQGSVPAVWSPVLILAVVLALDPVRLGLILLLISRPRPLESLLAYWVGAMAVSVPYMLVPLTVLHVTPTFRSFVQHFANPATFASPTAHHIQIGIGVLSLSIAALMIVRFRARQRALLATPGGTASTLVSGSNTPTAISRPLGRAQDPTTKDGSAIRRLRGRTRTAWENGSSWPAFMFGAASGPPPVTIILVITTIMASGAAIGTQVSLALVWVVGMFAVVEIILVSHLATPAKTQAALQLLHDWILAHRRQVLIALIALTGVAMMALGMGGIGVGG